MRKICFVFLLVGMYLSAVAQVTTEPAFITKDYKGKIVVTFDPSLGNKGMVGATACYAHTGLITDKSKTDADWKYAPSQWLDTNAKYKMTKVGSKWQLTINNMYAYYGCPTSEVIKKLAFVFNDGQKGGKEGKAEGGKDIFVDVHEAGLNVMFTAPTSNNLIDVGESVAFTAKSSLEAKLVLKVNGTTVKTVAAGTELNYTHKFTEAGDYACVIEASTSAQTVTEKVNVCVLKLATSASRPAGMKDGINYHDNNTKATLVMYAKDKSNKIADNIFVLGDFNDFSYQNTYQMKKDGNTGYFWITIDGLKPGEEYAFQYAVKIGDQIVKVTDAYTEKVLDPYSDSWIASVYPGISYPEGGDGMLSVLQPGKDEFDWSDATLNFAAPDKNNLVIYELWVGNYSVQKTLKEVTKRLDYFEHLGVNAIELMPVTEFDGNDSWGYNPNHFFAMDKAYGAEHDYKTFIDECHKRGIAVVLDMVFNHATGSHPWAKLYWNSSTNKTAANNPWFNVDAPHPYSVFHDYNHDNAMVRSYFKEVLKYWINEYKVDGYRMDLTKGFTQRQCSESNASNYDASRIAILKDYYNATKAADSDAYFIIEHFCDYSEEKALVDAGVMPWRRMNEGFEQLAMGYQSNSDISGANIKGWVSFNESHDEERNFYKAAQYGNGTIKSDAAERIARVPATLIMSNLLPGPKMFWQFAELGYDYSINFNDRTGMKPVPDTLSWYVEESPRMLAYQKVGQATQLRTKVFKDMFTHGSCNAHVSSGSIRYMQWSHGSDKLVVVANYNAAHGNSPSGSASATPFPSGGTWYEYFSGTQLNVSGADHSLNVPAGAVRIYINKKVVLPDVPDGYDWTSSVPELPLADAKCCVYPTVATDVIHIVTKDPLSAVHLFTLQGQQVKRLGSVNQVDVSDLGNGFYVMVCEFANSREVFKILKR